MLDEDSQFLWDSLDKEFTKGVASKPLPREYFDELYGPTEWGPTPCFCHTQANGKRRRIDNAKRGGKNRLTSRAEKFTMNSAVSPAVAVRVIYQVAEAIGGKELVADMQRRALETGAEGIPDAFRTIPTRRSHYRHNIVGVRHPQDGRAYYVQMYAALFGYESSVYGFGRWSAFLEAIGRRIAQSVWTMYVDDGNVIDLQSARGRGQHLIHVLFELLGTKLSDEVGKRRPMEPSGDFLGLVHDLATIVTEGVIRFWLRDSLITKMSEMLTKFVEPEGVCNPETAAKFRGVAGFCLTVYGKVGRAALASWVQRQYADVPPWTTSFAMQDDSYFLKGLLMEKPMRLLPVVPDERPPIIFRV